MHSALFCVRHAVNRRRVLWWPTGLQESADDILSAFGSPCFISHATCSIASAHFYGRLQLSYHTSPCYCGCTFRFSDRTPSRTQSEAHLRHGTGPHGLVICFCYHITPACPRRHTGMSRLRCTSQHSPVLCSRKLLIRHHAMLLATNGGLAPVNMAPLCDRAS